MQPMQKKNNNSDDFNGNTMLNVPSQSSINSIISLSPITSQSQRSYDDADIELHAHHNPSPSPKQKEINQQQNKLPSQSAFYCNQPQYKSDDDNQDNIDFLRIWIQRETQLRDTAEVRTVCRSLQTACMMRQRWVIRIKTDIFHAAW